MKFSIVSLIALTLNISAASAASFPPLDTHVGDATGDTPRTGCHQLTPALNSQTGAVWASGQIDISKNFDFETTVYVGANDYGADGIAFVLQNNGLSTIGGGGGGQGYNGITNAFVVELDTYSNSAASSQDFVQIWSTSASGGATELSGKGLLGFNIEDNSEHIFKVEWDGTFMTVSVDGTSFIHEEITGGLAQYVGGSNMVYYGYTGATGARNNVHYVCKLNSNVGGDPHFRTWTGEKFDFHGVCDLVLLQSPRMDIHIRTEKTRVWSYIHSAAVRIGDDILEVMGGVGENHFWLNKVRGDVSQPLSLNGHPVKFDQLSTKSRQFIIDMGNNGQIKLKTWNGMVSVTMNGSEIFDGSLGLMGSYPAGVKLARDGSTVFEHINDFGQEWQVKSTEPMLFHNIQGPQHPEKCEIPSASQMRRRLGESIISKEDAMVACSRVSDEDFDLCVFDVMATNDKDSAGAY